MSENEPAAVLGSSHTVRTRVDGSLSITIEVEPRHAQAAFALFGAPGTPVALARLKQEAAASQARQDTIEQGGNVDWGHVYQPLFSRGWFNNPRVIQAFSVRPGLLPAERAAAIKMQIYAETATSSMREIDPAHFVVICEALNIRDTIPSSILDAAAGRAA